MVSVAGRKCLITMMFRLSTNIIRIFIRILGKILGHVDLTLVHKHISCTKIFSMIINMFNRIFISMTQSHCFCPSQYFINSNSSWNIIQMLYLSFQLERYGSVYSRWVDVIFVERKTIKIKSYTKQLWRHTTIHLCTRSWWFVLLK